jgi:hypothetical protein
VGVGDPAVGAQPDRVLVRGERDNATSCRAQSSAASGLAAVSRPMMLRNLGERLRVY